jgi:hypothetical protein
MKSQTSHKENGAVNGARALPFHVEYPGRAAPVGNACNQAGRCLFMAMSKRPGRRMSADWKPAVVGRNNSIRCKFSPANWIA